METTTAPDPLARAAVLAVAGGRVAIGLGAFFATRKALGLLGFERPGGATVALARLAGGRDIALGLHALAASSDRRRLREAARLMLGAAPPAGWDLVLVARDATGARDWDKLLGDLRGALRQAGVLAGAPAARAAEPVA